MSEVMGRQGVPAVPAGANVPSTNPEAASVSLFRIEQGHLGLIFSGPWDLENAVEAQAQLDRMLDSVDGRPRQITLDLGGLTRLDTTGAWLIKLCGDQVAKMSDTVSVRNAAPDQRALIQSVTHCEPDTGVVRDRAPLWIDVADRTGKATLSILSEAAKFTAFFGLIIVRLAALARRPNRLRVTSVLFHMESTGLNAIPIVALLAFLVGVVIAYQGALQLRQFGAEIFTIDLLGFSVLRELGVLITSIIVAGRSGSAFAAQIGTMKVSEEVDAMKTIGLDVVDYLVLPRVIALALTLPMLVFLADLVALLGGAAISWLVLDVEFGIFLRRLRDAVDLSQLWVGLVKAPVFAVAIAMAGCYEGLKVSGSAQSVGERTTAAVVESIFLVILLDAAFSVLFAFLGI
ncbi:MAG: ABC transporter permease [Pseudomonadota bacterium]